MSDDHTALISQFAGVTGANADRSKFYLESANWKLDLALSSFFDGGDNDEDMPSGDDEPAIVAPPPQAAAAEKAPAGKPQAKPSRFGTIAAFSQEAEMDSSEEEGEAYYVGGSEHGGGQQVRGPPKKKKDTDSLVKDMFKAAREHGAEEAAEAPSGSAPRSAPRVFAGTAYRLGETEEPSISIPGFSAGGGSRPKTVNMVLKLWKEGFSIDDGPLRSYQDPDNKDFLATIKKGEVPRELIKQAKGGEVSLSMMDNREEEYVKPKVSLQAFSGAGNRLGSPSGGVVTPPAPVAAPSKPAPAAAAAAAAPTATVSVDTSLPTTQLQIRLSNGSKLVSKFNHSHKVSDIRQYILDSNPQFAGSNFVLMTTFPNKELTDESQSLKDAALLNAVIVQRMK